MLSTDKLTNYNNIQASVEKLTHEETKADAIEALNDLPDEQLQVVNSRSDILDKILRGIERYNNEERRKGESNFYSKNVIKIIVNLFSEGGYDRLINSNPNVLELLISHCTYIQDSFDYPPETGNSNHFALLNDDKFRCLVTNENFCKFLLKTRHMDNFLNVSSRDTIISNENFKRCINNQDLILVYCFTNKNYSIHPLRDLMVNPNRNSMIDKLYSLEQQSELYCDKKTLDLILLNLPIIKQMVYDDASDNVIETLRYDDYEKIELLLKSVQKNIKQEVGANIKFIKYPDESTFYDKNLQYKIGDISLLQTYCAAKLMQDRGISAELYQTQVTQAISNAQSLT
ncbi:MAG: hypothetical protein sL5_02060 [Candidatus Mesenet longicola]|uniref:Uncharacterized protein n=1 Tax=Candidatus Mesenet longicola TaxID=1892558 RepID=A0A8J3HS07_9RICK|nr:MAG: hypothetical protein sGL2_02050 [Candidatus Mesenet longicola]GHM59213.1 MAG: hypothetical protein sL5_02060 [Candidatus Mesenet longicola]